MLSHLGLRSRMAASYVLVSAAAVILVEFALLLAMLPQFREADTAANKAQERAIEAEQNLTRVTVQSFAHDLATEVGRTATVNARAGNRTDSALIAEAAAGGFLERPAVAPSASGTGVAQTGDIVQVLADTDGRVIAADPAGAYQPGASLPAAARGPAPADGRAEEKRRTYAWATAPIEIVAADGTVQRTIGVAYIEMDPKAGAGGGTGAPTPTADKDGPEPAGPAASKDAEAETPNHAIPSLVLPGAVVLALLVPVGALFGLLSTGRLIRRIRRLSDGTAAMAGGDLRVRIPVSGGDEVGRLERAFNAMAERLGAAVDEQRAAAGAEARRAERGRIARELHDSISQDLFSVSLVAAGMRKALAPGSALQEQAESMERALARTMREMRALLLELRPIQLEDAGLVAALDQLCRAYEARLGIPVTVSLDEVALDPASEHAVLRVVQEAIGNAIRHGEPRTIEVRLVATGDHVEVTVRDDGRGFDQRDAGGRHGMGLDLMRERLREVGGAVDIDSAPGRGTTVRVTLPPHRPSPH
ncbi:ATP-binding protein [Dactylosporangium sp. NPDC051541]|uniref:sensor histidine kinase n=1 Tax=Dactylosporangium sp. NPDC051541 TaxID=3363977 RepID=UPI0037B6D260